ncbi:hypothetical protein, unknown function [Leishmania mexicana MHOM/GT/2001/U1103]|uniref:Uncharacterized protein n=1 Tax=Leishmania mexicana (strain MHOM/GT/2001/U1103) TaxID=929439 RepID=E9B5D0_LEIMU|nr:hypothetical protein, unknown function [Leishmania mexicana MHOM/GT/2001/U1103]CBZ30450.1 hypothetical protein, unknown function [Leishmania mexicana MHOM/GT/2001/U1103]
MHVFFRGCWCSTPPSFSQTIEKGCAGDGGLTTGSRRHSSLSPFLCIPLPIAARSTSMTQGGMRAFRRPNLPPVASCVFWLRDAESRGAFCRCVLPKCSLRVLAFCHTLAPPPSSSSSQTFSLARLTQRAPLSLTAHLPMAQSHPLLLFFAVGSCIGAQVGVHFTYPKRTHSLTRARVERRAPGEQHQPWRRVK